MTELERIFAELNHELGLEPVRRRTRTAQVLRSSVPIAPADWARPGKARKIAGAHELLARRR